jgi:hypothetical protein
MSASSSTDDVFSFVRFIIIIVFFVVILVSLIRGDFNQKPRDPNGWYGGMNCTKCGYEWQSRRNTPPAACARCGSQAIKPKLG